METQPGPRSPRPRRQPAAAGTTVVPEWLKKPQFFLPALIVVGMLALAFGLQPGSSSAAKPAAKISGLAAGATTPTAAATTVPSPTPQPTQGTNGQGNSNNASLPGTPGANGNTGGAPTGEVAGARATPSANSTPEADLSHETTQCGSIQETATSLSVEQVLSSVSVRATRAAVYPIEYFRCILMATGGREAIALASSISKAQHDGSTHAVLIDLWITNSSRDFGQVNLKTAVIAAAGQSFAPLATLGGRAEVVVSGGQGRNVTLVVAIKNSVGSNTGAITLSLDAPLAGGKQTAGKYQLFLPTP